MNSVNNNIIIGKFVLDSLAIGMYNEPLMSIREYIQNSVDSLDEFSRTHKVSTDNGRIDITIDGFIRKITIRDNGLGISLSGVWDTLYNIGKSTKNKMINRGFRGIGRLGGLGYCDELRFTTKAIGEDCYSVNSWDCKKLRFLVNNNGSSSDDAIETVKAVSTLSQSRYEGSPDDHFLQIEMVDVKCCKDVLLDVPEVKKYIAQVCPVPFDKSKFSYSDLIETRIKENIRAYKTYKIFVNNEQMFKPYCDSLYLNTKKIILETLKDVEFFPLRNEDELLAFGWIANTDLRGSVPSSTAFDGLRLRSGNILVGNKNLLSNFFRETRFNNYLVGEIHVAHNKLLLNSRRDDFEDNVYKEQFYDLFVREIGIPYSKKIRKTSEIRCGNGFVDRQNKVIKSAEYIYSKGFVCEEQKNKVLNDLKIIKRDARCLASNDQIELLIEKLPSAKHILHKSRLHSKAKNNKNKMLNLIYNGCTNKEEAEKIIQQILKNKLF